MIGRNLDALEPAPRRWVQRLWGCPYINPRIDWTNVWPILQNLPSAGLSLLDAGCGGGLWSLELGLRRPGWHITGVDVNSGDVAIAEESRLRLGVADVRLLVKDFLEFRPEET